MVGTHRKNNFAIVSGLELEIVLSVKRLTYILECHFRAKSNNTHEFVSKANFKKMIFEWFGAVHK
jgi:hypothetical protein